MKWINNFLNYILFFAAAVCVTIFGYIYFQKTKAIEAPAQKQTQLAPDELVNKYLKETQKDLQKQTHESIQKIQNKLIQVDVSKKTEKEISTENIPVDMQIAKDRSAVDEKTLTETFDQKTYDAQIMSLQDEQAKKEYAKEYIANARKDGYQITLTDDLQIKSVKPLRRPTNLQNDNDTFESEPSN